MVQTPPVHASSRSSSHPKRPRAVRSCDISAQCAHCLDFFTLTVFLIQGVPTIANTPRVEWQKVPGETKKRILIHRPGVCNGEIRLYGTLQSLSTSLTSNYVYHPSGAKAAARALLGASGN